jgi:hypothetical protein
MAVAVVAGLCECRFANGRADDGRQDRYAQQHRERRQGRHDRNENAPPGGGFHVMVRVLARPEAARHRRHNLPGPQHGGDTAGWYMTFSRVA